MKRLVSLILVFVLASSMAFAAPTDEDIARVQALGIIEGDEGGIDWLVCRGFVESIKRGIPTPIDTYDTATWMAITPLTEQSIAAGGAPIPIPDFTRGKWIRREEPIKTKYSLDVIVDDPDTRIY